MASDSRSLHRKLSEVMATVGYVPKNGQGPGYKFAAASDVADVVREELAARHVTCLPVVIESLTPPDATTLSGKQALITLKVHWQFTDADSGESIEVQSVGTGADTTDKAAPKAMTNALKYALLLSFLIPTGDDPEASSHQEEATKPRRAARAPADEYPVLPHEELDAIVPLLTSITKAETAQALREAGGQVAAAKSLNESQLQYVTVAYRRKAAELKGAAGGSAADVA